MRMQPLLDEFATLFDLDHTIRGAALGDLVARAIRDLDARALPNWGVPGPRERLVAEHAPGLDFYYLPHLFPGMDVKLELGHKLQFSMLPREVPAEAPMSIAAVLESYCHLSGDLFGWEMLADGRFLIWIVDVAGHGVRAGLASAMLKILIDNLRERGRIAHLAAELNDTFASCLRDDKTNLFATGFFLSLAVDGTARFTSAGHPAMLLRRNAGAIDELRANGIPLGMFAGREFTASELHIEPDDTLLLYTDGVVEAVDRQGRELGHAALRAALEKPADTPKALTESLYRRIADHQDMAKLNDDVTFVAARMHDSAKPH